MRARLLCLAAAIAPVMALAQPPADGTLRVTVVDPSGGVIQGARVTLRPAAAANAAATAGADTGALGEAAFTALPPGRYAVHVEAAGFEPRDAGDVRVRPGENRREVKLRIARRAETVQVSPDAREAGTDRRGDAFASVLGPDEINELPDDPDEMERVLREMAGPGGVLRVNGFHGGKLPPKDQIARIRFRRNMFAADVHEPGFMSVDIVTKPGVDRWRGSTNAGFRDSALNARNAFAPVKGDEASQRYSFSLNGPLWKKHTSLSLSADGLDAFDSKTIVAALPSGAVAHTLRRPNDSLNLSARIEHALSTNQTLRLEAQRNHNSIENQGAGDFDLPERGYSQTRDESLFRASLAGAIGKSLYNELRLQWRGQQTAFDPVSQASAVLVLNAFNSGGAQVAGRRRAIDLEIADDLDVSAGKHALRAGFLLESARYRSDVRRNATGTFTFASLNAFAAGRPTSFTQNVGDPRVEVSQWQGAVYVQDDYRASPGLTLSGGVRAETQQHVGGLHLGPRGGLAWSPFKDGKTTVRAGAGIFFDWLDAQTYEQAVQLDGSHQRISTVVAPGYPDPAAGREALVLPSGRVRLAPGLQQPALKEASVGVERTLGSLRVNTMLVRRRGSNLLRGVNVNAPIDGRRPDPTAGAITEVRSIAGSSFDGLFVNLNAAWPERRTFLSLNYGLTRSINESDGPFGLPADSHDLASERGPAPLDARHRLSGIARLPLVGRLMLGTAFRVQSALPYNVTTGFDGNGDTVSNDRPSGVRRNSARGSGLVDLSARLSWSVGFGGAPAPAPEGPHIHIVRGGDGDPLRGMPSGDGMRSRYKLELYAQAYNLLNHTNALNFSGVLTSPFFGRATSAGPARRFELGARLSF